MFIAGRSDDKVVFHDARSAYSDGPNLEFEVWGKEESVYLITSGEYALEVNVWYHGGKDEWFVSVLNCSSRSGKKIPDWTMNYVRSSSHPHDFSLHIDTPEDAVVERLY